MRELTSTEGTQVSGGWPVGDFATEWGSIGTVTGYVYRGTLSGAARGGVIGAMLGASFGAGYAIGTYGYNLYKAA